MHSWSLKARQFYRYKLLTNHPHSGLIDLVDTVSSFECSFSRYYKRNSNDSTIVVCVYGMIPKDTNYYFIDIIEKSITPKLTENDIKDALLVEGKIDIHGILFKIGSSEILTESNPNMEILANVLVSNLGIKILIIGHTDNTGSTSGNLYLSQKRADAIANTLIKDHNIKVERIGTKGMGETQSLYDNATEEGRKLNRRIEIVKIE